MDVAELEQAGPAHELLVNHCCRFLGDFVALEVKYPATALGFHVHYSKAIKLQGKNDLLVVSFGIGSRQQNPVT